MTNVAIRPLNCISLCTGGGGLDLAVELAIPAARTVCMVEREAFAVSLLVEAMRTGAVAQAAVWSDAGTFAGRPWRGLVDGLFGGIPCQPHSLAGKRLGADDERDLWSVARRVFVQSGAWWILIENVGGMLSSGGAERVWRDLRRLGCSVEGGLYRASEVGAPHERERLFILGVHDGRLGGSLADAEDDHGRGGERGAEAGAWALGERRRGFAGGGVELADADLAFVRRQPPAGQLLQPQQDDGFGGDDLVDAPSLGRREGRPEPGVRGGRRAVSGADAAMVDTIGRGRDGRPDEPERGSQGRTAAQLDGGLRQPEQLADADLAQSAALGGNAAEVRRLQGREGEPDDGAFVPRGGGLGVFPPGPGDRAGWADVLARTPEFEPAVRRVADGLADRVDRLRMLGNGVVPLQGAYAIRSLAATMADRGSAGATQLVRMMAR